MKPCRLHWTSRTCVLNDSWKSLGVDALPEEVCVRITCCSQMLADSLLTDPVI